MNNIFSIIFVGIFALTAESAYINTSVNSQADNACLAVKVNQLKVDSVCPENTICIDKIKESVCRAESSTAITNISAINIICTEGKIDTSTVKPELIKANFDYIQYLKDLLVMRSANAMQAI